MDKLFVQIASYRDAELSPTVKDLFLKARRPERIRVVVLNQFSEEDEFGCDEIRDVAEVVDVHHGLSKGACWARSVAQGMQSDEDYFLQLDSHHRFEPGWDETLLDMYRSLEDDDAILTGHPPQYQPEWEYDRYHKEVYVCRIKGFSSDGRPEIYPGIFEGWKTASRPRRAFHLAAGFVFGRGEANKKVPYDPNMYFNGEECSMALRYFSHGFNLYHPHRLVCYHYYERKGRPRHWGDHKDWHRYDAAARERLDRLVGRNEKMDLGPYGLGGERDLSDWRRYSGIDFVRSRVHRDTLNGTEPPCSNSEKGWEPMLGFNHVVSWDPSLVAKCEDPRFWGFFVLDENKKALHREDIVAESHPGIVEGRVTSRRFKFSYDGGMPKELMIWPYSQTRGWLESSTQALVLS